MRIALYQPDIPQNTGTILRFCACFALPCDIIEPCGFLFDDRRLRRAGMDYLDRLELVRHVSWTRYLDSRTTRPGGSGRLILLTTRAAVPHTQIEYRPDDTLLLGRESAGVPDDVHAAADLRVVIPLAGGLRSLNVAMACAVVAGEALRQTGGFPPLPEGLTAPAG
ncbi:MAG: tRNA (cytidine(34)-2'-O)-methyltransferase [Caenispirillum bisanense]|nr:tRNA (cytidine(34)-2'-O)-methyltransferase [Caenispirillum bisanense]